MLALDILNRRTAPPAVYMPVQLLTRKTSMSFIHTILLLISRSIAPDPNIVLEGSAQRNRLGRDMILLHSYSCFT